MGVIQKEEIIRASAATIQQASYVVQFYFTQAGWEECSEDDLLRLHHGYHDGFLIIWKDVATISVAIVGDSPSGRLGLVGNVVVAQTYRGQGIGTQIVQRALDIAKQEGVSEVYLMSSPEGVPLYSKKLGFSTVPGWSTVSLELSQKDPAWYQEKRVSDCTGLAVLCERGVESCEHNKAIELDGKVAPWSIDRAKILRRIIEKGGKCAVVMEEGKVVGAAWGRMKRVQDEGLLLFIGPVLARNVRMVKDMCLCLMCGFSEDMSGGFGVNVVNFVKVDEEGESVCGMYEKLGFVEDMTCPFMVKNLLVDGDACQEPKAHLQGLHPQYYAVLDFDLG